MLAIAAAPEFRKGAEMPCEFTKDQLRERSPEIELVTGDDLRLGTAKAWPQAWRPGDWDDIADVPKVAGVLLAQRNLAAHTRSVAFEASATAETMAKNTLTHSIVTR
jgi:hypothetical protein